MKWIKNGYPHLKGNPKKTQSQEYLKIDLLWSIRKKLVALIARYGLRFCIGAVRWAGEVQADFSLVMIVLGRPICSAYGYKAEESWIAGPEGNDLWANDLLQQRLATWIQPQWQAAKHLRHKCTRVWIQTAWALDCATSTLITSWALLHLRSRSQNWNGRAST